MDAPDSGCQFWTEQSGIGGLAGDPPAALAAIARGNADLHASEAKLRANKRPAKAMVGELDPLRPSVDRLAGIMKDIEVVVVPGAIICSPLEVRRFSKL